MSEQDFVKKLIDDCASKIGEHATSVRIIAVIPNEDFDCSRIYTNGRGCFYSQVGSVREWLTRQDELSRIDVRKDNDDA